jgi:hypothetical protein
VETTAEDIRFLEDFRERRGWSLLKPPEAFAFYSPLKMVLRRGDFVKLFHIPELSDPAHRDYVFIEVRCKLMNWLYLPNE